MKFMKFRLYFDADNAAFDDNYGVEIARILRAVADRVEDGAYSGLIRDINGNGVGTYALAREPEERA